MIKHVPCPRCRDRGQDTRGNNLAIYADGHKWCFSCHYYEPCPIEQRLLPAKIPARTKGTNLDFPDDFSNNLSVEASDWLRRYGITFSEIKKHKIGWSPSRKLVIFPIYGEGDTLLAWQGRSLELVNRPIGPNDRPTESQRSKGYIVEGPTRKYLTFGTVRDIAHVLEPDHSKWPDMLIVVEGVLDAIKVSRVAPAMPLFGSHMPLEAIIRASKRFYRLGVWLDRDKTVEAVKTVLRASQYISSFMITTPGDPKEYSEGGIEMFIEHALQSSTTPKEPV